MEPSPLTCSILLIYGIKFESITYYTKAYIWLWIYICFNNSIKLLYIHSTSTYKDLASHFYYKIKNSPSL